MSYYYPHSYFSFTKQEYETLPINTTERVRAPEEVRNSCFVLHNHEALEFNAVLRGQLEITLDGEKHLLKPGEVLLANPFAPHSGEWVGSDKDACYLTLIIHISKFMTFRGSPMNEPLRGIIEGRFKLCEFYAAGSSVFDAIKEIHRLYHDKSPANDALCLGQVYSLLGIMLGSFLLEADNDGRLSQNRDFLRSVCAFVSENYAKDVTTRDAADAMYMDMSQFCRVFRRHFGMNFSNYLCRLRVTRAAELFADSNEPVYSVAEAVGFRNYSYFSRSFKRYIGVTPARYFGKWSTEKE